MTRTQKAQLALLESRKALSAHLGIAEETRGADWASSLETLTNTVSSRDAEHTAASIVEPDPIEVRSDSEGREMRGLLGRANLGEMLSDIINRANYTGVNEEIRQHFGIDQNQIPLEMLETRAVTPAPSDVEGNQQPIVPYVFPRSSAAFLGIPQPTVSVGEAIYPVLTSELTVGTPAENAEQDETTGSFSADVLSPARLQASFFYSREDRARFAGMDEALRENLSMGLAAGLDKQIISGTNGLLTGTNLANHNVTGLSDFDHYVANFAFGRVDGRFANSTADLRIVMGSATYAHAAGQFRNAGQDGSALSQLTAATSGVRVSAHVPALSNANKQDAVIRLGQRRDMVAPVWQGVAIIPDEITKAKSGQLIITAVMLYAIKILRSDGFFKQQSQTA